MSQNNILKKPCRLCKISCGAESNEYAIVLNNHAILLAEIGRIEQAVTRLNNAIAIMLEKLKKKNTRDQVGFNLTWPCLSANRKIHRSGSHLFEIGKDTGKHKDPFYAGVLNNLALLYVQMGQTGQSGKLPQALGRKCIRSRFGNQNPNYAKVLSDLGNFYRIQGRFAEAEQNLTESLTIRSTALDTNHPDYVQGRKIGHPVLEEG